MAYAAALGDPLRCYFDTRDRSRFIAHPMFSACIEWPLVLAVGRSLSSGRLTREEAMRGVHAAHDMIIHRPIRPPEKLTTRAAVVAVERGKSGAFQILRFETVDESGAPVCSTWNTALYRDVEVSGPDRRVASAPPLPAMNDTGRKPRSTATVHIAQGLAHIYTECARIWNPIHTDAKVAESAGLPAIILHGTATLALGVSRVIAAEASDPTRVARIAGRFRAMVLMPSDITVRVLAREAADGGGAVFFEVLNEQGQPAIANGVIVLREQ
jgi:acyl dehydratase